MVGGPPRELTPHALRAWGECGARPAATQMTDCISPPDGDIPAEAHPPSPPEAPKAQGRGLVSRHRRELLAHSSGRRSESGSSSNLKTLVGRGPAPLSANVAEGSDMQSRSCAAEPRSSNAAKREARAANSRRGGPDPSRPGPTDPALLRLVLRDRESRGSGGGSAMPLRGFRRGPGSPRSGPAARSRRASGPVPGR